MPECSQRCSVTSGHMIEPSTVPKAALVSVPWIKDMGVKKGVKNWKKTATDIYPNKVYFKMPFYIRENMGKIWLISEKTLGSAESRFRINPIQNKLNKSKSHKWCRNSLRDAASFTTVLQYFIHDKSVEALSCHDVVKSIPAEILQDATRNQPVSYLVSPGYSHNIYAQRSEETQLRVQVSPEVVVKEILACWKCHVQESVLSWHERSFNSLTLLTLSLRISSCLRKCHKSTNLGTPQSKSSIRKKRTWKSFIINHKSS